MNSETDNKVIADHFRSIANHHWLQEVERLATANEKHESFVAFYLSIDRLVDLHFHPPKILDGDTGLVAYKWGMGTDDTVIREALGAALAKTIGSLIEEQLVELFGLPILKELREQDRSGIAFHVVTDVGVDASCTILAPLHEGTIALIKVAKNMNLQGWKDDAKLAGIVGKIENEVVSQVLRFMDLHRLRIQFVPMFPQLPPIEILSDQRTKRNGHRSATDWTSPLDLFQS